MLFMSYSSKDSDYTDKLRRTLRTEGIKVWDELNMEGGSPLKVHLMGHRVRQST